LKSDLPEIEVIVMTAFGDIDMAIRAMQLDASDFITKPINDKALTLALNRAKERYLSKRKLKEYTTLLETGWSSATRALMKNFTFQEQIIESSINGIIAAGPDGRIKTINSSAANILGYEKEQAKDGLRLSALFEPAEYDQVTQALETPTHGGTDKINLMETVLKDSRSSQIPVQISASVLFEDNKKNGVLLCVRDLTELRQIERKMADQEQILHQDKMVSLGKLAASMVHEINNPLSGILNYLKLMAKIVSKGLAPEKTEKFSRYLDIAITETDRCSRIVSNLLTFSRKSSMTFEPVDVTDLIRRCELLSRHKLELQNVTLTVETGKNIPRIRADANQIQQCIINLIFNALDAMPERGGTITVAAEYEPEKKQVTVRIKDTGTGIDEKDLPHIFEPFYTTKDAGYGVGLGLSTVYGIMERHGGAVQVETTSPDGTHFVLRFNDLANDEI
jgi:PAS domain S-box-containing protein